LKRKGEDGFNASRVKNHGFHPDDQENEEVEKWKMARILVQGINYCIFLVFPASKG
jgi:hypothetical protein